MHAPDVIRDPIYGPVVLDDVARALIDTPVYQRLRRIRQLSEAYAVYPSAMHTRFEHSVGVYHLATQTVAQLEARHELVAEDAEDARLVPLPPCCTTSGITSARTFSKNSGGPASRTSTWAPRSTPPAKWARSSPTPAYPTPDIAWASWCSTTANIPSAAS